MEIAELAICVIVREVFRTFSHCYVITDQLFKKNYSMLQKTFLHHETNVPCRGPEFTSSVSLDATMKEHGWRLDSNKLEFHNILTT